MRIPPPLPGACVLLLCLAAPPTGAEPDLARQNYLLNCQGCHLADAGGTPGKVPRMRDFLGNFLHVPGGREYLVRVPGVAGTPLDDAQLAQLLNWVLRNFSAAQLPEDFRDYRAAEVAALRASPLVDVGPERARLLALIEARLGVVAPGP